MSLNLVPVPLEQKPPINLREFVETVATMRRLQRSYFKFRKPEVMQNCKKLEREVDEMCRRYLGTSARDEDGFHLSNDDDSAA